MKTKLTFALVAFMTSTAFAEFQAPLPEFKNEKQLAEWRAEKASEATSQGYASEETAFYTGKPYLASSGGYAFKYRSYNPVVARWTSEDPSGFPDGANCFSYVKNNVNVNFDYLGFVSKSVLWVTLNNLFGYGNLSSSGFNYMSDFNASYAGLKSNMQTLDSQSSGSSYPTNYLSDGDLFDKTIASSNADFTNTADGYTKVFFITHGDYAGGQYTFLAPDGQWHPMSYFDNLWDSTSITMLTCYNGFAPPVNQSNGSTNIISWGDAISSATSQTRNYLYE